MSKKGFLKEKIAPPPKAELEHVYEAVGGNKRRVGKHYDVSLGVVVRWFQDYEIKTHKSTYGKHVVPTAVFAPILRELMDGYSIMTDRETGWEGEGKGFKTVGRHKISEEVGDYAKAEIIGPMCRPAVSPRRIGSILNGHQNNIAFDTCDRLLAFFEANHLWTEPPLEDYYWAPNDHRYERSVSAREVLT